MKLQFTNGYRPHFDQISRILQYINNHEGNKKIPRSKIVDSLGIPEKQVDNLISMMVGFGLLKTRTSIITPLGEAIVTGDTYFESIESLWIIHYTVASNPKLVVWYRIINEVMANYDQFGVEWTAEEFFDDLNDQFSERTITQKLPTEVGAVYASYTRSELAKLSLINEVGKGLFKRNEPVDVPPLAFLYTLIKYRDSAAPGSSAMTVDEITNGADSPGRVMFVNEYRVRNILSKLHDHNLIRLELFGDLDQISFNNSTTKDSVLDLIYGEQGTVDDKERDAKQLRLDMD